MLSPRERFISLLDNHPLEHADVIVLLTGGGLARVAPAVAMYTEKFAPRILISGGLNRPPFSLPARVLRDNIRVTGVPDLAIEVEENSMNTREQAVEVVGLAVERGWRSAILVTSHFHHYRAYLTFLKAIQEFNIDLRLSSFAANSDWGPDLLDAEFNKIELYHEHIASFDDGIKHILRVHRPNGRDHQLAAGGI